jgi:hypothetical protein
VRRLVAPPKGQYEVRLPDEVAEEWLWHKDREWVTLRAVIR